MPRLPQGFFFLLIAQFFSSWADNALLIVAMAQLMAQGQPAWTVPLLKCVFTISYVLLAPWVGVSADGWPKTRIMWISHALKLAGVFAMWASADVLGAYALVGVGAALYSPAKYGWMTQRVPATQLVRANGWIETSTVCAAMGGVACGGWWVSTSFQDSARVWLSPWTDQASSSDLSIGPVLAVYALALILTWWVPGVPAQSSMLGKWWPRCFEFFRHDWLALWRDPPARTSLCITTLFWGVGASMQLMVLSWAQTGLGLGLDQGAYLQGWAGLGVMAGAWWAGRYIQLANHHRVLGCGLLLGLMLPVMVWIDDWLWALPLTWGVGALSGLLVVPMNAMLQHRGGQVLTAGRSIAVQNFNENLSILLMLGMYAVLTQAGCSFSVLLGVYAALISISTIALMWRPHIDAAEPVPSRADPLP
jgi:MFS transporter, LPLT family, lysophospholipid transporter